MNDLSITHLTELHFIVAHRHSRKNLSLTACGPCRVPDFTGIAAPFRLPDFSWSQTTLLPG
ncbi:hypothetical protein HJA01_004516 [Salmonella enterica]|nr:hypothetical protein [Salmonella enterica]